LRCLDRNQVDQAGLNHIRDAKHSNIRETVIAKIDNRAIVTHKISSSKVQNEIAHVFNPPQNVSISAIQRELHRTLTEDQGSDSVAAKEIKGLQVNFDDALARRLDELYRNPTEKGRNDSDLFNKAFEDTYHEFRQKFSFFKPSADPITMPNQQLLNNNTPVVNGNRPKKKN
jgi:hypothetical protein